jgi:TolB-like protein
MPSVIPGCEYDIFISYRHNDNLNGWVTDFVEHLQRELRGTIKDPVSVYFDTNPHDGLSAHHDVSDSLREKLRCAVLVPIVSRTYCDTHSFAWKNELVAFVNQAQQDQFGIKVKLPNGNVASRVLPLRIHEIDREDRALFESVTGSVMRPIDMIYKSTGVNRPLLETDKKEENDHHTLYRNQVNMVANAVDEILKALRMDKPGEAESESQTNSPSHQPSKKPKQKWYAVAAAVLITLALVLYLTLLRSPSLKDAAETGLAILPFRNNTGEPALGYYGVGMASEIRTKLSMSKKFSFLSSLQATLGYDNTNKSPAEIGGELGVDYLLTGIYRKSGQKIKVDVELLDAETGLVVWTLPIEKEEADIFEVQETIAQRVLAKFYASQPRANNVLPTKNLQAYAHYVNGMSLFELGRVDNRRKIEEEFERAIQIDSSFHEAWMMLVESLAYSYLNSQNDSLTKMKIDNLVRYTDSHFPDSWQQRLIHGTYEYRVAHHYDNATDNISWVLEVDPDNQLALQLMSYICKRKFQFDKAFQFKKRIFEINPNLPGEYNDLAEILLLMGDYKSAWRAQLKSWKMGRTGEKGDAEWSGLAENAMLAGLPLDSIPNAYKTFHGEFFELWMLEQQGQWRQAIIIGKKLQKYEDVCYCFQLLNQEDSARHYARLGLSSKKGSAAFYYAFLGEKEKALAATAAFFKSRLNTEHDKMARVGKLITESLLYVFAGDYTAAVQKVNEINSKYPNFNGYQELLIGPVWAKIRREYPPFLQAINNRQQQPMPDVKKFIKL